MFQFGLYFESNSHRQLLSFRPRHFVSGQWCKQDVRPDESGDPRREQATIAQVSCVHAETSRFLSSSARAGHFVAEPLPGAWRTDHSELHTVPDEGHVAVRLEF